MLQNSFCFKYKKRVYTVKLSYNQSVMQLICLKLLFSKFRNAAVYSLNVADSIKIEDDCTNFHGEYNASPFNTWRSTSTNFTPSALGTSDFELQENKKVENHIQRITLQTFHSISTRFKVVTASLWTYIIIFLTTPIHMLTFWGRF